MKWAEKGSAAVLVGGQFGSEGKGQIAAWLAHNACSEGVDIATTNAGAQAGHTTQYKNGTKFICYHLPTVGVIRRESKVYINGGSIIDVATLKREIAECERTHGGIIQRLVIHPRASIITEEAKAAAKDIEQSPGIKYGAIQKGVGQTLAGKVLRRARVAAGEPKIAPYIDDLNLNEYLENRAAVTVEIPQGTGLGLIHGHIYPYTTSRDCWVGSGFNDAGIHPSFLGNVAMVVRTFPIRVGHSFNEMGEQIGDSGPFYPDSQELRWEDAFPGIEPERTTVSKRIRRIATWSNDQYAAALSLNRPDIVALTFVDYLRGPNEFWHRLAQMENIEKEVLGRHCQHVYSFGPHQEDVTEDEDTVIRYFANRAVPEWAK